MMLSFSDFTQPTSSVPPGELWVRLPNPPHPEARPGLALLALRQGPSGFVAGRGLIERVVVKADPTLDDMLAAAILTDQLRGESFPDSAPLAHYAENLAGGFHPAKGIPIEELIEAHFQHYRTEAKDPLTDPSKAEKFLAGWRKMAPALLAAIRGQQDAFRTSPLHGRPEFNDVCLLIGNDRNIYERDLKRSERWLFQFPGSGGAVPALRLTKPESSLFKFWARTDPRAAVANGDPPGYKFLAVDREPSDWFFSVDRLDRYRIDSLARELQKAEEGKTPAQAGADGKGPEPWYDGKRHGYTIVRPPEKQKTSLTDDEIWAAVKRWGQARPWPAASAPPPPNPTPPQFAIQPQATGPRRSRRRWLIAVGAAVIIAATAALIFVPNGERDQQGRLAENLTNGQRPPAPPADPSADFAAAQLTRSWRTQNFPTLEFTRGTKERSLDHVLTDVQPSQRIQVWLEVESSGVPPGVKLVLPDGQLTSVEKWEGKAPTWRSPAYRVLPGEKPEVHLKVSNPDPRGEQQAVALSLHWRPAPRELHLYVLTLGVSNYGNDVKRLEFCNKDAEALRDAFLALKGPLFAEVTAKAVTDATSDRIINEIYALAGEIRNDKSTALKLAVVTFAGHGTVLEDKRFIFLPQNYKPGERATAVSWAQWREELSRINCTTLVILDCCHSGQAALEQAGAARSWPTNRDLGEAITGFAEQEPGLFVLAAADRNGYAYEDALLKHGVLTYEVLQVLGGKTSVGASGLVTLKDLHDHVSVAVRNRAKNDNRDQVVIPSFPGGRDPAQIPIAYFPRQKGAPKPP
jgi:uncharacterized caspase-like protein